MKTTSQEDNLRRQQPDRKTAPQENYLTGRHRRTQEDTGGHRRTQEDTGGHWRTTSQGDSLTGRQAS